MSFKFKRSIFFRLSFLTMYPDRNIKRGTLKIGTGSFFPSPRIARQISCWLTFTQCRKAFSSCWSTICTISRHRFCTSLGSLSKNSYDMFNKSCTFFCDFINSTKKIFIQQYCTLSQKKSHQFSFLPPSQMVPLSNNWKIN